ncbi:hypothetical protein EUGRSUZ_C04421 [Eucalyptus grandis]|uniref:Uncharacterized protein n=2 Tax=Eucalyptus grandis TaxID=71139 RepID=A0ACC3LKG0_EUCGR|nr:hypothetical protein EUGRSUZ_C04421 [Eucalyptus grandis]
MGILSSHGPLTSLRLLSSTSSDLSGDLSYQSLCNLAKLEELDLSFNGITGRLPTCWRNMTSIRILNLEDNEFTNSIASSPLTSLTSLEILSISVKNDVVFALFGHVSVQNGVVLGSVRRKNATSAFWPDFGRIGTQVIHFAPILALKYTFRNFWHLSVPLCQLLALQGSLSPQLTIDTKVASSTPRLQLKVFSMSNSQSKGFNVTSLGFLNHQYDLRIMDLSSNDISGPFPAWLLENNTKLEKLVMANNLFTTLEVPSMTLFNLSMMDISNNDMRGELTTKIWANVPNLFHLNLSANKLEGSIPSELGSIKSLYFLDLSSNNFSRGLPIQLLDSVVMLDVAYNNLQGEFVFSDDTMNLNLSYLRLGHNKFTGNLSFLSSHINLWLLDISNNLFISKIPRLIANLSSLTALDLSKNQLDGGIPQELCNLGQLEYLDLSNNNLYGPLPSFFVTQEVSHIHLNRNKLNGTLVHALSNSSYLVTLDLSENEFFGSIPHWLGNLSQLSILSLRGNSFDGTFPKQLCSLKSLSIIDLSQNNLFGPLPSCLGPINFSRDYANKFYQYDIERQEEALPISHSVGFTAKKRLDSYKGYALLEMVGLDFSCNQFSGEIPPRIAILQDMLVLNLSNNKLTGHIPTSLSSLTKIESINLSYNNLIGSIPEELTQLNFLEVFNVSYNNLSGAIPNKNQFGAFDESSYYRNHLLCGVPLSKNGLTTIDLNCSTTKSCTKAKEDGFIDQETFYISFGMSYTMVLLVIPVVLFINPQWRQGWFHYMELVITICRGSIFTCYYFVQYSF